MSILRSSVKRGREAPLKSLCRDDREPLGNVDFRKPGLELPNPVSFHKNRFFFVVFYFKGFEEMRSNIDRQTV